MHIVARKQMFGQYFQERLFAFICENPYNKDILRLCNTYLTIYNLIYILLFPLEVPYETPCYRYKQ